MKRHLHEYIVYSTDPMQINSPAFYDCVVHLICLEGKGTLFQNGNDFSISPGRIAVLNHPRNTVFSWLSEDFRCEYIAAPERFLHNLLPANSYAIQGCVSLFSNPIIEADEAEAAKFHTDLHNIRSRIDDVDHQFYTELMGSLLQTMMYDLFDFHARQNESTLTTDRVGYVASQFFNLIQAGKPRTERSVSYYADRLHVSAKYLSDTIKRVTGENVSTHINRAATAIIIEYLRDNSLSVSQIADEMNFASLSYFSRFCSKHLGMSPAAFRTSASG